MGLLARLLRRFERRYNLGTEPPGWITSITGGDTAAGAEVTADSALTNTAVLAAIRLLATSVAQLPLVLYERMERGRRRATEHPLYDVLHQAPNGEMTPYEFKCLLMEHLLAWGNAYAEIERNGRGEVLALWPLRPDRMVRVERVAGRLQYFYRVNAGETEQAVAANRILHTRGLSGDGYVGYSLITLAKQAIGLGLAAEEFGARFFGNGARPGVIFTYPGVLSNEAMKRIQHEWEDRHGGLKNAQRVAILEEGMDLKTIGMPNDDAQFLETRKLQVTEVARIFGVPPHMIGDLERATFSNIEHQGIEFVTFSLGPWLALIEQRIDAALLMPEERKRLYCKFSAQALLRGDIASRYQAYATGRQWGWMSANDVRELEDMNPVPGGDVYLTPMNMMGVGEEETRGQGDRMTGLRVAGDELRVAGSELRVAGGELRVTGDGRRRLAGAYRETLADVAQRVVNREVNDVGNAARKWLGQRGRAEFQDWLTRFYSMTEHLGFLVKYLMPVFRTYARLMAMEVRRETGKEANQADLDAWVEEYLDGQAQTWARMNKHRLLARLDVAMGDGNLDPLTEVEAELADMKATLPGRFADDQTFRFNNAAAVAAYGLVGITRLIWQSVGENCPWCDNLNGRVVGIEKYFILEGATMDGGDGRTFTPGSNVRHPPLHAGCDCMVVAG